MKVPEINLNARESLQITHLHQLKNEHLQLSFKIQQLDEHFKTNKRTPFAELLDNSEATAHDITSPTMQTSPNKPEKILSNFTVEPTSTYTNDFIITIWPLAKKAASVLGLDPKILIAQAALETGWGKFIAKTADGASSNNLFNIKGEGKNSVSVATKEYSAVKVIDCIASFKKYASFEESFNDYVAFIKGNSRYQLALSKASNPEEYLSALHKAGYATDPTYVDKIMTVFYSDKLNQALL